MDDRASSALLELGRNADNAERKTMGLKEALLGIGAALGVGQLWQKGKESFFQFNSQVEQAKLGIASVRKMFNTDMSFDVALAQSDKLFEHYQQVAKKSTGTTMDFVNMHKDLAGALEGAGASLKDMKAITQGTVTSAPALGFESGMAALDIKQMMAGTVGARDRFASMLIQMGGEAVDKFNAKAKKDPKFVLDFLSKAFSSEAMTQARERMEHTAEGAMSTLKDNIEINLGKAGKPLFDAIASTLNGMNDWVDKHPKEIESWVNRISKVLMDGFGAVKAAIRWVVDHKTELLAIGGAFATLKGMSIVGGGIAGGLNDFAGSIMGMKDASLGSAKGLLSFTNNLTSAVGALGALYLAAQAFADWVDSKHKSNVEKQAENTSLSTHLNTMTRAQFMQRAQGEGFGKDIRDQGRKDELAAQGPLVQYIKEWGAFTKDAKVDWAKFSEHIQDINLGPDFAQQMGPAVDEAFKRFSGDGSIWSRLGLARPQDFDGDENKRKTAKKTNVNVTIHKIEVASPDPDRFAFGLDKAFKKLAQNPTTARDTMRGGF
jgi:hypothetical protein